jgi:hypothetical protein
VFARVHVLETTSESDERGLEIVRDQLLPYLRDSTGFRGLIRLAAPDRGKTLVITLWADEEALAGSLEAAARFGDLSAEATGAKRLALEQYEATFFDVTA